MKLHNGFLLIEVVLYGAIATLGVLFFVATLRIYVSCYRNTQQLLSTFLYHYHALAVLHTDLSVAGRVDTEGNTITIHRLILDRHWCELSQTVIYSIRKKGLYRQKMVTMHSQEIVKSSLRLASSPRLLTCVMSGTNYELSYTPPGQGILQLRSTPLCTQEGV